MIDEASAPLRLLRAAHDYEPTREAAATAAFARSWRRE